MWTRCAGRGPGPMLTAPPGARSWPGRSSWVPAEPLLPIHKAIKHKESIDRPINSFIHGQHLLEFLYEDSWPRERGWGGVREGGTLIQFRWFIHPVDCWIINLYSRYTANNWFRLGFLPWFTLRCITELGWIHVTLMDSAITWFNLTKWLQVIDH